MVRVDSCSDWIKEAGLSFSQYISVNYQEVGVAIHGVYPCCLFKLPEFMCPESFHERFTLRILHWLFQSVPDWGVLFTLRFFGVASGHLRVGPLIQDEALAYSGKVDSILVETEMPTELESFKEICLATDVLLGERISTSMMWNFASNCIAGSVGLKNNSPKPTQVASECSDDEVSSNISREEGLECPICFESFNIVENVPYVLWCGHTSGSLKFPRKNYFLLWMLESMNGDREKSHSSFSGDHHQPVWSSDSNLALGSQVNHRILRREQFIHHSGPSGSNHEDGHVNNYLTLERLHSSLHKSLVFFVQLTAKFPLVVILLLIVLYAIPASAAILALYILITVLFALHQF
ncbi:hypothetical protein CK203_037324 [Vitis vinifera]|uniref:RING-type domain-containing protein n=1 Tax=Vitis vinifera TaxID=29760 RepID=A0A438H8R5_VITVI|nr:hypothetical protein CK203_037324 [Vitis vinifera]